MNDFVSQHGLNALPSPWPHRLAVLLCCATFPLIWVGGLVTTYDAGMAVPDWPTTYGYNLFLYPWQTWLFGPFDLFIEHGHRLLGAAVGIIAISFVGSVFLCDKRSWMRFAATGALALIITQGILGGARVRMDDRGLAMSHALFGLATFAYLAAMAVVTSRYWKLATAARKATSSSRKLQRLSYLTAAIVYVQIVLGALLRHMPAGASHQFFRFAVLFHLFLAAAVLVHAILLIRVILREHREVPQFTRGGWILVGLVISQVALGGGTWVLKYGWPGWLSELPWAATYTVQANSLLQGVVTTAHVAVGALILSQSVVLSLRAARFFRSAAISASSGAFLAGCTT